MQRRDFMRGSLAASLSTSLLRSARAQGRKPVPGPPPTPFTIIPFQADLPIPAVIRPLAVGKAPYTPGACFHGIAPEFSDLKLYETVPTKYYSLDMVPAVHEFIPGVKTPVWTYGGTVPGPTFRTLTGEPVVVRVTNRLPVETSVHLHGGHLPAHSDGYPTFYVLPGKARDYFYPNTVPLRNGTRDITESPSTCWYHDHAMDITGHNAYMGLQGFYLNFDTLENNLIANNVLPGGIYDVPLALADKRFNADGSLYYDFLNHDGELGDIFCVNGKVQPKFTVERRKYRFRILIGSNSRHYRLRLSNGQSFLQIGNDSWLLPNAIAKNEILLSPAKRADIVIDFTNAPSEFYLENTLAQADGKKPDEGLTITPIPLIKFIVKSGAVTANSTVTAGTPLRPHVPIQDSEIEATRRFVFDKSNGGYVINEQFYDPDRADAVPRLGSAERWILENAGGGWWHPVHIHLESHQIRRINGAPPSPELAAKNDTVILRGGDVAEIVMKFRTFPGPFVFHCHNLEHEDLRMMFNVDPRTVPVPAPTPIVRKFP